MLQSQLTLIQFLLQYIRLKLGYFIIFFFRAILWAIATFLAPYLLKLIIDTINSLPHDKEILFSALLVPTTLYISTAIVAEINERLYDYTCLKLYPNLKAEITKNMYSYLIKHSYSFFQRHFSGSLAKKISDISVNIELMFRFITETFVPVFSMVIISSIMLLIIVHWMFAVILITWAVFFVVLSYLASIKLAYLSQNLSELDTEISGRISESISAITSVKLFGVHNYETQTISNNIESLVDADYKMRMQNLKINLVQGFGITILMIAMLAALFYTYLEGISTIGDFTLVLGISISILTNIYHIGIQLQQFSKMYGICRQALSIVQEAHEIVDIPNAKPIKVENGLIEFKNVTFNYPNNKTIFKNLNIKLYPGQKVGLVGYSGGGKSTFIKLILRLIEPSSGSILIDNQNINTITLDSLTNNITIIPQNPDILHRSIADNIKFAKPEASNQEVILASKKAHCHAFISSLPDGYDTLVGERGVKLSGGQIQRLAIARAFLKNSSILLLDEPTSSLDSVTENNIQKSLQELMKNKTTLVIAHRLSTLKELDRILVFENGKIIEDGNFKILANRQNGAFSKFWQIQTEALQEN